MIVFPYLPSFDLAYGLRLSGGNGAVDCDVFAHTIVNPLTQDLRLLLPRRFRSQELDVNSLAQAVGRFLDLRN